MKARFGGAFSLLDTEKFISSSNSDYSYFFPEKINDSNVIYFETGVDSLAYIIKQIVLSNNKIKEIYFPSHYCQNTIDRLKIKVNQINILRYTSIDELVINRQAILLLNHFNKYQKIKIESIPKNFILIEDFVHAPYDMKKSLSSHCFNSLRKVCNIDVSVCYSLSHNVNLSSETSEYYLKRKEAELVIHYFQKLGHNLQIENKFLNDLSKSELLLHNNKINLANELEVLKFKHLSHNDIYKLRLDNYIFAKNKFNSLKNIDFIEGEYMYLMIRSNQIKSLKTYLAKYNIFTTCHWADSLNQEIARNYISIYVDQRYNVEELRFVMDKIVEFYDC